MLTNPSAPAYPCSTEDRWPGLTKRELFAAVALNGMLATGWEPVVAPMTMNSRGHDLPGTAVRLADALIEALNKEKK